MNTKICSIAPGVLLLLSVLIPGCQDSVVPLPNRPSITSFTPTPVFVQEGDTIQFAFTASADAGLLMGVIAYGDGTGMDTVRLSGTTDQARTSHAYLTPGTYYSILTVIDASGIRSSVTESVRVWAVPGPWVVPYLHGTEGTVSTIALQFLVNGGTGPLKVTMAPISAGLVFQSSSDDDSVRFYLTDRNDNGMKEARVTAIDKKNRTVERVVQIQFDPRDDISGRIHDRFEGTYLASLDGSVVIQPGYTGWAEAIRWWGDTVRVAVDASGRFAFQKLQPAERMIRAFITNGRDSSFISTRTVPAGDQVLDISVETNAGTGMPLGRLLDFYRQVNFSGQYSYDQSGVLSGVNLRNGASDCIFYLLGRDTVLFGLNARGFSAAQQEWLSAEIEQRCFAHLPPGHRPRIVRGGLSDRIPFGSLRPPGVPSYYPLQGYAFVFGNLLAPYLGQVVVWDQISDGATDCGRITLKGGDLPDPPYGMSLPTLVKLVEKYIAGTGTLSDRYYDSRSIRAEFSQLERPSVADMKLDWQVVFETPRITNYIEARYFVMPR